MKTERIYDKEKIIEIIKYTFSDDKKLFEKYHLISSSNGDIDAALKNTCDKVIDMLDNYGAEFYSLVEESNNDELLGYLNIAPTLSTLHSFGLKINHRTFENKKNMITLASRFFKGKDKIFCFLYKKNKPAGYFLKKAGFEQYNEFSDTEPPYEQAVTLIKYL